MSNPPNISELLKESDGADKRQDWVRGEQINKEILLQMRLVKKLQAEELLLVARRYLRSIFGAGLFLFDSSHPDREVFIKKVERFRAFVQSNQRWHSLLEGTERDLHEVQLFLRMSRADARNKAANALRRLGRPDLTIKLCDFLLVESKLNYYVLTTRSWAFGDLGQIDKALVDAELAMKYQPKGNNYPQTALSRAYRQRFKRDGDLDDSKSAIRWGREALIANRNFYAANQLVTALLAAGVSREDPEIQSLEKEFPNVIKPADRVAIESATDVIYEDVVAGEEDFEELNVLEETEEDLEGDSPEDFYEDYFPEHLESLRNPRLPHLEP